MQETSILFYFGCRRWDIGRNWSKAVLGGGIARPMPQLSPASNLCASEQFWSEGKKARTSMSFSPLFFLGEDAPRVSYRWQIAFLAVKNVVKFWVTSFKPIFPGEDWQKNCHPRSTTFFTPEIKKFHHLELSGPLSRKVFRLLSIKDKPASSHPAILDNASAKQASSTNHFLFFFWRVLFLENFGPTNVQR